MVVVIADALKTYSAAAPCATCTCKTQFEVKPLVSLYVGSLFLAGSARNFDKQFSGGRVSRKNLLAATTARTGVAEALPPNSSYDFLNGST
jgi:hypothetical protein